MLDKDYAIQLAMEYGFTGGFDAQGTLTYDSEFVEAVLEAIKHEREACAKVCEDLDAHRQVATWYSQAIRARAQADRGEA